MRLVLDTNTTVSSLLWSGPPRSIIDAAIVGDVNLFSSPQLLVEPADVLARPKLGARLAQIGRTAAELLDAYSELVTVVEPVVLPDPVSRDPDDDSVHACALTAGAEAIVSGDQDLLVLGSYQGIPVLSAADLVTRLAPPPTS